VKNDGENMSQHTMNSQVQAAIDASAQLAALSPQSSDPLAAARNSYRQLVPLAGEPELVHIIEDHLVETSNYKIPIRIYNPSGGNDMPAVIFFHGGWFIGGDLETHDRPLRALANAAGCIVVAVDYRLAPEHPFPAAIDDGYAVLQWADRQGAGFGLDPKRLIIAGDSAGGTIATVLARKAAENNGPHVLLQVLLYPVIDPSLETESWREFAEGPVINIETARQAWQMYVPNLAERQNADAAPVFTANLAVCPGALIIIAEYDPLRDEGIAYGTRLKQAGVNVKTSIYKEMPHGFFQMAGYINGGRQAIAEVARAIKNVLRKDISDEQLRPFT
jgi:acetyl esterase